jgi:hypothetical protein
VGRKEEEGEKREVELRVDDAEGGRRTWGRGFMI